MDQRAVRVRYVTTTKLQRIGRTAVLLACLALAPALHAATLDPAELPRVQAATFEVVIQIGRAHV